MENQGPVEVVEHHEAAADFFYLFDMVGIAKLTQRLFHFKKPRQTCYISKVYNIIFIAYLNIIINFANFYLFPYIFSLLSRISSNSVLTNSSGIRFLRGLEF